jgi:NADH-quinone oxidoreductase subunit J
VLFVFVIMMLNLGPHAVDQEREWLQPGIWVGPAILCAILLGEFLYVLTSGKSMDFGGREVEPQAVGYAMFTRYLLATELASMLLLAGLIGAYHLGRRDAPAPPDELPEGGK